MAIYEQAELLLLGANKCGRCGKLDSPNGRFFKDLNDHKPSVWLCSKCLPLLEMRAWHLAGSWWTGEYFHSIELYQSNKIAHEELRWYEKMDAMRLVWLDEYWTEED